MSEFTFIYGLIDPQTQELRYIGKADNIEKRLGTHLSACEYERNHKANWLKSLKKLGLKPDIFEIEKVSTETWQENEIFWIRYFKYIGANLTNDNEGGLGGISPSEEVREKQRRAMTGLIRGEEFSKKISKAKTGKKIPKLQGRWVDPNHLRRITELARTPEARAKQSRGAKQRANSPEAIERMKNNNPAKRDDVRKKMREIWNKRRKKRIADSGQMELIDEDFS